MIELKRDNEKNVLRKDKKMNKIILGIIDNKRPEFLAQTITSIEANISYDFLKKVIIDDSGDAAYGIYLQELYGNRYHIISHVKNLGLSGSVRSLWGLALFLDADFVMHIEGDFTFNQSIDVEDLWYVLGEYKNIAQVALKRQPCNPGEIEVGGFMKQNPESYRSGICGGKLYVTHRNFFTLNPCVYPRWVMELGWEQGWGEKEFGERLFANPETYCAYLGKIDDPPLVEHIGNYRGNNWFV